MKVPVLDPFVKHVNVQSGTRATKERYRNRMWQNFERDLRKVHKGVRFSMLNESLNLMASWRESNIFNGEQWFEMKQLLLGSLSWLAVLCGWCTSCTARLSWGHSNSSQEQRFLAAVATVRTGYHGAVLKKILRAWLKLKKITRLYYART